ncbi:MAG: phosphoribosylformylglycinamidine synthase I [Bacteroidales bacterium]
MSLGILIFPGAHGDKELLRVLDHGYGRKARLIWNQETRLDGVELLFVPGGLPCKGSSQASKCIQESQVIDSLLEYADRGKLLVGIGNGFRLLCDTGLLPGNLRMNRSQRYICRNTYIKPDNDLTPLTKRLSGDQAYRVPIATGYGRYAAKEETLVHMRYQDQILFRYCDRDARISEEMNATGSVDNIAGICNEKKNIFGIIPQPERAFFGNGEFGDGKGIFDSLLEFV